MNWDQRLRDELTSLTEQARSAPLEAHIEDLGEVLEIGDGVVVAEGLIEAAIGELVIFANGITGQVIDLDHEHAQCVLFGPDTGIEAGTRIARTQQFPEMPVGTPVLGRVLDPLGQPRDGLESVRGAETRAVEQEAPGPLERQPVREPLLTGIKIIDSVIPLGRGQRELILGDRSTGKTSIALDAIINQRGRNVPCVYVSIGARSSTVVDVVEQLQRNGALEFTTVIVARAEDPAALRYLAPYAGCAIAEWFAYHGEHALIVYDDLTRHAEAYRELSLLLRRPPSREAFPGDIFSIHASLLERAFKLNDEQGGGSVTALPIAETQRGNISGFIPTNLISITDGQIFLDTSLFAQGQLPAINIGLSVSRIGGDAQPGTLREASSDLRLEVAQYEDVKGFARFGSILDEETRRQIERGRRLVQLLEQNEREVVPLPAQVVTFWAFKQGLLDDIDPEKIHLVEQQIEEHAHRFAHVEQQIATAPAIDQSLADELRTWVTLSKQGLSTSEGSA